MEEIRTLTYKGLLYFERESLLNYLREFASTEDTDTRKRILEAIENLNGPVNT